MCGSPAVPSTSARPSETVSIGVSRKVPGASEKVVSGPVFSSARLNSSIGLKPTLAPTKMRHDDDAGHQQHGLDDLHPRRGEHAAEDDVAEHEGAGDQHREREVDPDERLDEHARADHLRDQVEGRHRQRADRRRSAGRPLAQPEGEHVGDRVLAGVAHALGEQEHHGEEGDEEPDRVQEPVEAVQVDEPGDAQERRGREVVAGDREAVLEAGDLAAGGVERRRAGHALGRPVGDAQRDREDDREDDDRLGVDVGGEEGHAPAPVVTDAAAPLSRPGAARRRRTPRSPLSASGSNSCWALRRYQIPRTKTMTNCVSARQ